MAPSLKTFKVSFNSQCLFSFFLASSEASTPPVDVEHNEMRTNIDGDCNELQGKFKQINQEWRREREILEMLLVK